MQQLFPLFVEDYQKFSLDELEAAFGVERVTQEFFDNYKDYRYLPGEDTVIPRSLAESLPKDRYIKATRETCCKKISARFMKQPEGIFTPVFKTSFKDKARYFRFPEDFNKEAADEFGCCLINVFFNMRKKS